LFFDRDWLRPLKACNDETPPLPPLAMVGTPPSLRLEERSRPTENSSHDELSLLYAPP